MTAQTHEHLELDGVDTSMAFEPPIPSPHPRIRQSNQGNRMLSTACWRGYVGHWAIREGRMYLLGFSEGSCFVLDGPEPLFADWFSGVIRVPQGEMLHYVHMGYASIYAQEIHIKVEHGVVTKRRVRDNRERQLDPDKAGWLALPGEQNNFDGDDL